MLIVNGIVHTAVDPEPVAAALRFGEGRIQELGRLEPRSGEEVLDAGGMHVYPGLVDAHSHIGLDGYGEGYAGNDVNENNDCVTPELDAVDAINPFDPAFALALAAGVTCVATGPGSANVLGGTFAAVKTCGTRVDDMIVRHRVAMKCAFGENPKNCYRTKAISSRMTSAARIRETLARARDYMRRREDAPADSSARRPDLDFRLEALLPVLRGEIPLKAHAHQANDMFTAIRIAREFGVGLTLEHCTEGHLVADALAAEGIPLAVGPSFTFPGKPEMRSLTFATPGILAKAGCRVSIITDCGVTPQQYLALMAALAVRSGMAPFDALQAITIHPAQHLGIADRVGSLEPGKDADAVLCDGPLLDPASQVVAVFLDGRKVAGD